MHRPTVAVIGAGFSGVLTALHLLADPDGPRVRLVERARAFGRGAAFGTANPDHLLNVRVANMSAFADEPDHFVRWLAGRDGWNAQGAFVSRGCYGDYLQELLRRAVSSGPADRLLLEPDEAVDLSRAAGGWRVHLAMGRAFQADAAVLALGAPPPPPPEGADPEVLASPRYVADPWAGGQVEPSAGHVLLLGAGLTMVDVALGLSDPGRRFTALSRRGLVSRTHGEVPPHEPGPPIRGGPLQVLREVRRRIGAGDWRGPIDDLRPDVTDLWRSWSLVERQRFLRHLRPWWDVCRHRVGPVVARRIEVMRRSGLLDVRAGRTVRLSLEADHVAVAWRPRGVRTLRRLKVEAVVNCAGALGDIAQARDPFLAQLVARGFLRPDASRLGADVDEASRPIGADGRISPGLFAVGPLTRGAVWEMTSVPDIRIQAAQVARAAAQLLAAAQAAG